MTGINRTFSKSASSRLQRIYKRLRSVDEGRDLVGFLEDNDIDVFFEKDGVRYATCFTTITSIENGRITYGKCSIGLNEELNDDNLLQALVHEAQHMRQHLGQCGNPDFWPNDEDHCLMRRFQEADAQAMTTHIVYLLKQRGDRGPYEEVMKTVFAPMCDAFEATCETDPNALHNGHARRAAFDSWFDHEKSLQFYDRNTITNQKIFLQHRLWENEDHGIEPADLTPEWLSRLGNLSNINYLDLPGTKPLTGEFYRRNISQNLDIFHGRMPAPRID